jgi:hypothetical protein
MKAQEIAKAEIAFNVNVKNFKTKVAQDLYKATFKRLLNDFKADKITMSEMANKMHIRYYNLHLQYEGAKEYPLTTLSNTLNSITDEA